MPVYISKLVKKKKNANHMGWSLNIFCLGEALSCGPYTLICFCISWLPKFQCFWHFSWCRKCYIICISVRFDVRAYISVESCILHVANMSSQVMWSFISVCQVLQICTYFDLNMTFHTGNGYSVVMVQFCLLYISLTFISPDH